MKWLECIAQRKNRRVWAKLHWKRWLEHETDGELDHKMMMMLVIEYDDNEAIGHDHKYHLYHSDDYHFVASV